MYHLTPITKKHALRIALLVGAVAALWLGLYWNAVANYTFATGQGQGGLELTISSRAHYNNELQPALTWGLRDLVPSTDHFFDFSDVKPGDRGDHLLGLLVEKNQAYACLDFSKLAEQENGLTSSEALVDTTPGSGELADELYFFAWRDDGDGEFEVGEAPLFGELPQSAGVTFSDTSYAIADASTGTKLEKGVTYQLGIVWCAGVLTVDLDSAGISCDGQFMGNSAQTDSLTVDVSVRAVQAAGQQGFCCVLDSSPQCGRPGNGNNGHGNDVDDNDNSNPGRSNNPNDDTDDDSYPPGQQASAMNGWREIEERSLFARVIEKIKGVLKKQ